MTNWRKYRRTVSECHGKGGKPGPCPEESTDPGAEHGVGGKTDSKTKKGREKLNQKRKLTDFQHQVTTDIKHLAGDKATIVTPRFGNIPEHGEHGVAETTVLIDNTDDEAIKKVATYAKTHGLSLETIRTDDSSKTTLRIKAPQSTPSPDAKEIMPLQNAALQGDRGAIGALADKLQEQGNSLGRFISEPINTDPENGYSRALTRLKNHISRHGSIFAKDKALESAAEDTTVKRSRKAKKQFNEVAVEDTSDFNRVDEAEGVIYDVLVLGLKARNRRHYLEEAREEAVTKGTYEGLDVYIGPHKKSRFSKRSPRDHAGQLEGIYKLPNGEIRAKKLVVNKASDGGKLALEIAKKFPKAFGLSHHADVQGVEIDGEKYISRILEASVVDIIKDPGTTDGVFEDTEMPPVDASVSPDASAAGGWQDSIKSLIASIHDSDDLDDDVKLKATKDLMKLKKLLGGEEEDDSDDEETPADAPPADAEESVDVIALLERMDKRLDRLEKRPAKPVVLPQRTKTKSTARSTVTEDVTPTKPVAPDAPKDRKGILAAYNAE